MPLVRSEPFHFLYYFRTTQHLGLADLRCIVLCFLCWFTHGHDNNFLPLIFFLVSITSNLKVDGRRYHPRCRPEQMSRPLAPTFPWVILYSMLPSIFFAVLNESTSWLVTQSVRDMVRKMPHHAVEDAQKASTRWIFTQNPPWALRGDRWK